MSQTFHLSKAHRDLGWASSAACVVMLMLTAWIAIEAPPDRRLVLATIIAIIAVAMALLAAVSALAYRRISLTIDEHSLTWHGLLRSVRIELDAVTDVHWRPAHRGIVVRSSGPKINIAIDDFAPPQREGLIRAIRRGTPPAIQHKWPAFCHRYALPLRLRDTSRPLHPGEVLITRRRYDRVCPPVIVLAAVATALVAWLVEYPQILGLPAVLTGAWLLLRLTVPQPGLPVRGVSPRCFGLGVCLLMLPYVGLFGWAFYRIFESQLAYPRLWAASGFAVLLSSLVVLWRAFAATQPCPNAAEEQIQTEQDAEEWERLEAAGAQRTAEDH
jgi:hypothetical protein